MSEYLLTRYNPSVSGSEKTKNISKSNNVTSNKNLSEQISNSNEVKGNSYKDTKSVKPVKTYNLEKHLTFSIPQNFSKKNTDTLKTSLKNISSIASNQDPIERNQLLSRKYDVIDKKFTKYLGVDNVANWTTFGKHASKNFGVQLETLKHASDFDLYNLANDSLTKNQFIPQGIKLFLNPTKEEDKKIGEILTKPYLQNEEAASSALMERFGQLKDSATHLYNALAQGNKEIFENIAPAYEVFLEGEKHKDKNGKGMGLEFLKKAGYYKKDDKTVFTDKNHKDPQGFINKAFTYYSEAKELFSKSKSNSDSFYKQGVEKMKLGNLYIGIQEQLCIAQKPYIFGDSKVSEMVDIQKNLSSITDSNGTHGLLYGQISNKGSIEFYDGISEVINNDKNKGWSDFSTRMGFVPTNKNNPNAIKILMPDNKEKYFIINKTSDRYTITTYFNQNVSGNKAKNNIEKF